MVATKAKAGEQPYDYVDRLRFPPHNGDKRLFFMAIPALFP